jgi:hypothetical protein
MVFLHPDTTNIPRLQAYILPSFPASELEPFKRAFELGTCAPFAPMLELMIQPAPAGYEGDASYAHMRRSEDEAGRTEPFVLLDARAAGGRDGSVLYVDRFALADEVDDGEAASTDVVWRIRVRTEHLALMHVNYDIANMTLQEDLVELGVEFPIGVDYEIPEAADSGDPDFVLEERKSQIALAVAYPGEYEESAEEGLRKKFLPLPDKVARLKEGVAEEVGLINDWTIPSLARPVEMPDGSLKEFPEGSVQLQLRYDPDFDWPEYRWPEGSL